MRMMVTCRFLGRALMVGALSLGFPGLAAAKDTIRVTFAEYSAATGPYFDKQANADIAIIGTRWLVEYVKQDLVEPWDTP